MLTRHRSSQVQHSITPMADGVILCVWETANPIGSSDQSFLFKVNQRLASQEEAQQILRLYLERLD